MAKHLFRKADPAAPRDVVVPAAPPQSSAELTERVLAWRKLDVDLTAQILQLERAHVRPPSTYRPARGDARKLLDGTLPEPVELDEPEERLASLHHQRDVVKETLALADNLQRSLLAREASQRYEQHKAELYEKMTAIARAVVALEHALQARDRVLDKIRAIDPVTECMGWPFCGRLSDSATQAARFLNFSAMKGWLSQREVDREIAEARKA